MTKHSANFREITFKILTGFIDIKNTNLLKYEHTLTKTDTGTKKLYPLYIVLLQDNLTNFCHL